MLGAGISNLKDVCVILMQEILSARAEDPDVRK